MSSNEFAEHVLILRVGCFKEADCWVRLLSPSQGIMTAFAFGGKKSRKRFSGCLDTLNHVLFTLRSSRGGQYFSLEEGTLLNGFPGLRKDSQRLGMAVNCIKFLEAVHLGNQGTIPLYEILLEGLQFLESSREVSPFFPLLFRVKIACDQGYSPDISGCTCCKKNLSRIHRPYFSIDEGRIYCQKCRPHDQEPLSVHPGALHYLSIVMEKGLKKGISAQLPMVARQDFYTLMDMYMRYHLGVAWEGNRFKRV